MKKKLDEIFKTNPELLNKPEVKELINYFEQQYSKIYDRYKKVDETLDSILELLNDNT